MGIILNSRHLLYGGDLTDAENDKKVKLLALIVGLNFDVWATEKEVFPLIGHIVQRINIEK